MFFTGKPGPNAWLWWVATLSLALGFSIHYFLKPAYNDYELQRVRVLALLVSLSISGLCIIIGTSKKWFGKGL